MLAKTKGLTVGLALGAALMAGIVAWRIDHAELLPAWVLVAGVGSWLVFIDWRTRLLPYVVVAPTYLATLALVGLGALLLRDADVFVDALVANIVVYVIFRVLHWIARGAFGFGDVRLSGVLAAALGALGTNEVTGRHVRGVPPRGGVRPGALAAQDRGPQVVRVRALHGRRRGHRGRVGTRVLRLLIRGLDLDPGVNV